MKTRYVVLVLLSLIMFTNISCDEDDILVPDEPEQVEFTTTNYIYEGDLRKYYLETENTRLNDSIAVWQQIPDSDPNYDDVQDNIAEANMDIDNNNQESESIASPNTAFIIINPIPPIPPSPSPCLCLDVYNSIGNIVFQSGNDQGTITITSAEDQSTIVSTNANTQMHTIQNTDGLGRYQSFDSPNNFTGEAVISVQTDNGSYSIDVNFQDL